MRRFDIEGLKFLSQITGEMILSIVFFVHCSSWIFTEIFLGEGRGLFSKIKNGCLPLSVAFLITIDSIRIFSFTAFLTNMAYFSFVVLLLNWPCVSKIILIQSH